jgi:hypothetical protein
LLSSPFAVCFVWAGFIAASFILNHFFFPETKGLYISEIDELYESKSVLPPLFLRLFLFPTSVPLKLPSRLTMLLPNLPFQNRVSPLKSGSWASEHKDIEALNQKPTATHDERMPRFADESTDPKMTAEKFDSKPIDSGHASPTDGRSIH